MTGFHVILFDDFETLDAFGPVEVIGKLDKLYAVDYYSLYGGTVTSRQNAKILTKHLYDIQEQGVILIPGGFGTRREAENAEYIANIKEISMNAKYVLTVCTGSGLLAKTGLLKGVHATSNKLAFDWSAAQDVDVLWERKARWVKDGKYYTSSGVSAGMDMALGFVADTVGMEIAKKIAYGIEYIWNEDRDNDPFCAAE